MQVVQECVVHGRAETRLLLRDNVAVDHGGSERFAFIIISCCPRSTQSCARSIDLELQRRELLFFSSCQLFPISPVFLGASNYCIPRVCLRAGPTTDL